MNARVYPPRQMHTPPPDTPGGRIRHLRKLRRWRIKDLSTEAGCSYSQLWNIEANRVPDPGATLLAKIAAALHVDVEHLLHGTPQTLTPAEDATFIARYRRMSDNDRRRLREIAHILELTR